MIYLIVPINELKEFYPDWQYCRKSNDGTKAIIHASDYDTLFPEEPEIGEDGLPLSRIYPYPTATGEEINSMPEFDYTQTEEYKKEQLAMAISMKVQEINAYNDSPNVNEFFYNGQSMWLSREERTEAMKQMNYTEEDGEENFTMPLGGVIIDVPVAEGKQMIKMLDQYAFKCESQTEQHKINIKKLKTAEEVEAYDITAGYPAKPNLPADFQLLMAARAKKAKGK